MVRLLAAARILLGGSCSFASAEEPDDAAIAKLVGTWKHEDTKWDEVWTFQHKGGEWQATCTYMVKGKEVGSATGGKFAFEKGVLSFTRTVQKKPGTPFPLTAELGFQLTEDGAEIFPKGKEKSARAMTRVGPAPKDPKAKPEPKAGEPYTKIDEVKTGRVSSGPAALSPDGKRVAMFNRTTPLTAQKPIDEVAVWDFAEKKVVLRMKSPGGTGRHLAWSADGKTIVSSSTGLAADKLGDPENPGNVTVWDAEKGEQKASFESDTHGGVGLAVSADGNIAAATAIKLQAAGTLRFWNVADNKEIGKHEMSGRVALSRDGKTALVGDKFLDTATGKVKQTYPAGEGVRGILALSGDGKILVRAHHEASIGKPLAVPGGILVYDTAAGPKSVKKFLVAKGEVTHIALLDDGKLAVVGSTSDEVQVVDTKTGKIVHTLVPVKNTGVSNVLTSADSSKILIVSGDFVGRTFSTPFPAK